MAETLQDLVDQAAANPPVVTPEPVVTPPVVTTPPVVPSTNGDALRAELQALQGNIVREQAQRIVDLQQELATRNATPAPADDAARFLEAPRTMIREELQKVVAPLMEFMGGIKKNTAYDNLKAECKRHEKLGPLLTRVEAQVDQLMAGSEPNAANLQTAIFTAIGLEASGLGNPAVPVVPVTPPTPVSASVTNPPYIPPSPPAPPRSSANNPTEALKAKVAAMTESEREVARRWGMTPEQYVTNRDAGEDASGWKGGTNV